MIKAQDNVMHETPYMEEILQMGRQRTDVYEGWFKYRSSLPYKPDPALQKLLDEVISLIRPDKWKKLDPADFDISTIKGSPVRGNRASAYWELTLSGKFRWADGSIHHTNCWCHYEKKYVESSFSPANKAKRELARKILLPKVEKFYSLLQEAADGCQDHVNLAMFHGTRYKDGYLILYRDGTVFLNGVYLSDLSLAEIEDAIAKNTNLFK